ncbi:MAG: DMT family transporter [Acetobacteraceae bacterium]|nr:DMT family transporter [Acetobacteraceae bacterium]
MAGAGLTFTLLNTLMRLMSFTLDPLEIGFLRYLCGLVIVFPLMLSRGVAGLVPHSIGGQFWRGAVHTSGMLLWFTALPFIPLADNVAIGFTSPIFIMLGASLFLGERLVWARWVAAAFGFLGVLLVVAPSLSWLSGSGGGGYYQLVMLGSSPLFAASFLIVKALTRRDRAEVIVLWQSITVALFLAPFAFWNWTWPSAAQWAILFVCGILGSLGHYLSTRALRTADASATQSVKFVDLIWASLLGMAAFGEYPTNTTMLGGFVIFLSTTWIARREARLRA